MLIAVAPSLGAQQGARRVAADADLVKDPGGTVLARVAKDAVVTSGSTRGAWQEVTIEGWVQASSLRDDRRDGFDVAVNLTAGAPVRGGPGSGATVAIARAGALLKRLDTRTGWVHVRRTGWIPAGALAAGVAPPRPAGVPAASQPGPTTLAAGGTVAATHRGAPVAIFESPMPVTVLERREGWTRVRIDAWVPDEAISDQAPANQITGINVRENPERYIGQTVEWTLQVLAVQKADELRPELPLGQPYILSRGPVPETGFVYLVVSEAEAARFRELEPLAKVRVRATIRSGRTRFLPTPVLNFVRRLD